MPVRGVSSLGKVTINSTHKSMSGRSWLAPHHICCPSLSFAAWQWRMGRQQKAWLDFLIFTLATRA